MFWDIKIARHVWSYFYNYAFKYRFGLGILKFIVNKTVRLVWLSK